MNDPLRDFAAFCLAEAFNEDEEECFLVLYFGSYIEESYKEEILIYEVLYDSL